MSSPVLDEHGHYPGCYSHGCAATRCAEGRWMAEYGRAERIAQEPPPTMERVSDVDRETRAIAAAAAALLNEGAGARGVALELLAATRRR